MRGYRRSYDAENLMCRRRAWAALSTSILEVVKVRNRIGEFDIEEYAQVSLSTISRGRKKV